MTKKYIFFNEGRNNVGHSFETAIFGRITKILTGTEPLNEDCSPPHRETRTVKLEMEDKIVQIKNSNFTGLLYV